MTAPQPQGDPTSPADPPKPGPPPVMPADAPKGDDKPAEGQHGYPEGVPLVEMTERQQIAYLTRKARREEDARKAAQEELKGLKPKADEYDALLESTKSEQERAVEAAKKEAAETVRAQAAVDNAGARLVGLLMVRGKSEEDADAIVSDLNLAKYVKDGKPDTDELRKAADRLAPKVTATPPDLGQGRRDTTKASGVAAGSALYEARHPKAKNTT